MPIQIRRLAVGAVLAALLSYASGCAGGEYAQFQHHQADRFFLTTLWAWGYNDFGQVGDGTTANIRWSPVLAGVAAEVQGNPDANPLAAGRDHSVALLYDGSFAGWGRNTYAQLSYPDLAAPNEYDGAEYFVTWNDLRAVTATSFETVALRANGSLVELGELGTQAPLSLANVTQIDGGDAFGLALTPDGTVWSWGGNWTGQLGRGTTVPEPLGAVNLPVKAAKVSAGGEHALLIASATRTVWSWGYNGRGQLGRASPLIGTLPAAVVFPPEAATLRFEAISAGGAHSLALSANGEVWAWGANGSGQLGDGSTVSRSTPAKVPGLGDIVAIAAGANFSLALGADGGVWAWGDNMRGQLGIGANDPSRTLPTRVGGLPPVKFIAAGAWHALAMPR